MAAVRLFPPDRFFDRAQWSAITRASSWRGIWLVAHAWIVSIALVGLAAWSQNPALWLIAVIFVGGRQLGLAILMHDASRILVTHGTDTMVVTGRVLAGIAGKTIVMTGAMQPASVRASDAEFNVGFALAAVQTLPPGVYVAMNGMIFDPAKTVKDRAGARFVQEG